MHINWCTFVKWVILYKNIQINTRDILESIRIGPRWDWTHDLKTVEHPLTNSAIWLCFDTQLHPTLDVQLRSEYRVDRDSNGKNVSGCWMLVNQYVVWTNSCGYIESDLKRTFIDQKRAFLSNRPVDKGGFPLIELQTIQKRWSIYRFGSI